MKIFTFESRTIMKKYILTASIFRVAGFVAVKLAIVE